jgi:hypothetical protein
MRKLRPRVPRRARKGLRKQRIKPSRQGRPPTDALASCKMTSTQFSANSAAST